MTDTQEAPAFPQGGLKRIFLLNSYFSNQLVVCHVEGHTYIVGENGSGKTSFLRLIPIFLGIDTRREVTRETQKKSFADFYLPTLSSLLCFEYQRGTELKCTLIYRSADGKAVYRLVDAGADEILSAEHLRRLHEECRDEIGDFVKRVLCTTLEDYRVSNAITSCKNYRAVIQNNRSLLASIQHGSRRELSRYAARFGLCSDAASASNLDELCNVVLNLDKPIDRFRDMIVAVFLRPHVTAAHAPEFQYADINTELEISLACSRARGIALPPLQEALASCGRHLNILAQAQSRVSGDLVTAGEESARLDALLSDCRERRREKKLLLEDQITALSEDNHGLKGQLNAITVELEQIRDTNERYLDGDIAEHESAFAQLPSLERQAGIDRDQYLLLLRTQKTQYQEFAAQAESEFEAARHELELKQNKAQLKLSDAIADYRQSLKEVSESFAAQEDKLRQSMHERLGAENRHYESERATLTASKDEIFSRLCALGPEEEDRLQQQALRRKIAELGDRCASYPERMSANGEAQDRIRRTLGEHRAHSQRLQDGLGPLISRLEALRRLRDGAPSLQEFLTAHVRDWQDTIGKIIDVSLLERCDLNPSYNPAGDLSLYGLDLDLSRLGDRPLPGEPLRGELLEAEIARLGSELQRNDSLLKNIGAEIKSGGAELERLEREAATLILESRRDRQLFRESLLELEKLEEDMEDKLNAARRALLRGQQDQQSALGKLEDAHTQNLNAIKGDLTESTFALHARRDDELRLIEEKIARAQSDQRAQEQLHHRQMRDLRTAFAEKLDRQGVPNQLLIAARQRMEESAGLVKKVQGFAPELAQYHHFRTYVYPRLADLERERLDLRQRLEQGERELNDCRQRLGREIAGLTERIQELEKDEEAMNHRVKRLQGCREIIAPLAPDLPEEGPAVEFSSLNELCNACTASAAELKKSRAWLSGQVMAISTQLISGTNAVSQTWQHEVSTLDARYQGRPSFAYYMDYVKALDALINSFVPTQIAEVNAAIDTVGQQLQNYHDHLDAIERSIQQASSKLRHSINTDNPYTQLSDIKVELRSRLTHNDRQRDEIAALHALLDHWHDWKHSADTGAETPGEELIGEFRQVLTELNQNRRPEDLSALVELEISFVENGQARRIRTNEELLNSSSTGMSRLAVMIIFCAMSRYLCPDRSVAVPWAIDELGEFDSSKMRQLFKVINRYGIQLICGQPTANPLLLRYFSTKNEFSRQDGIFVYHDPLLEGHEEYMEGSLNVQ